MKIINEMALTRSVAIDRCISFGKQFLIHFDKIYNNPKSISREHWETEMDNCWNEVKSIILKQNSRKLSVSNLHDWFFSAGQDPSDFFTHKPLYKEEDCYDEL